MGNCIDVLLTQNGAISSCSKQEFGDQKLHGKVYPAPSWNPLYCGMIDKEDMQVSPPIPLKMSPDGDDILNPPSPRTVKIVVTKKQLEELLKNMKELEAAGTRVHFADSLLEDGRTRYKWRPSLATIHE